MADPATEEHWSLKIVKKDLYPISLFEIGTDCRTGVIHVAMLGHGSQQMATYRNV
jgi:hypothetical protein